MSSVWPKLLHVRKAGTGQVRSSEFTNFSRKANKRIDCLSAGHRAPGCVHQHQDCGVSDEARDRAEPF